jgi:hypothetical protein
MLFVGSMVIAGCGRVDIEPGAAMGATPATTAAPSEPVAPPIPTPSEPPPSTPPPTPPPTSMLPSTGPTLPRPTLPSPAPTMLASDGAPMTLPIPPDPNEVDPDRIPEFYEISLAAVLVGRALEDGVDMLVRTGWSVRTDDVDDPDEVFEADLVLGRATVHHRDATIVEITVG